MVCKGCVVSRPGVPYRVYKGAPDVLKYLWKLVIVWGKKRKNRRQAGGVFIPKEKNTVNKGHLSVQTFQSS